MLFVLQSVCSLRSPLTRVQQHQNCQKHTFASSSSFITPAPIHTHIIVFSALFYIGLHSISPHGSYFYLVQSPPKTKIVPKYLFFAATTLHTLILHILTPESTSPTLFTPTESLYYRLTPSISRLCSWGCKGVPVSHCCTATNTSDMPYTVPPNKHPPYVIDITTSNNSVKYHTSTRFVDKISVQVPQRQPQPHKNHNISPHTSPFRPFVAPYYVQHMSFLMSETTSSLLVDYYRSLQSVRSAMDLQHAQPKTQPFFNGRLVWLLNTTATPHHLTLLATAPLTLPLPAPSLHMSCTASRHASSYLACPHPMLPSPPVSPVCHASPNHVLSPYLPYHHSLHPYTPIHPLLVLPQHASTQFYSLICHLGAILPPSPTPCPDPPHLGRSASPHKLQQFEPTCPKVRQVFMDAKYYHEAFDSVGFSSQPPLPLRFAPSRCCLAHIHPSHTAHYTPTIHPSTTIPAHIHVFRTCSYLGSLQRASSAPNGFSEFGAKISRADTDTAGSPEHSPTSLTYP